jgi:hypothetical protein
MGHEDKVLPVLGVVSFPQKNKQFQNVHFHGRISKRVAISIHHYYYESILVGRLHSPKSKIT